MSDDEDPGRGLLQHRVAGSRESGATPELTTTLKEDMGRRLGALKLFHGGSSGLQETMVVISGVAVHHRVESSQETPPPSVRAIVL